MTDEQIIYALERCGMHQECCYCNSLEECGSKVVLTSSTLDLINRLQADKEAPINGQETLQKHIAEQKAEIDKYENIKTTINKFWNTLLRLKIAKRKEELTLEELAETIGEIETDAIKEFWDELKKETMTHRNLGKIVYVEVGDDLVKELTEQSVNYESSKTERE